MREQLLGRAQGHASVFISFAIEDVDRAEHYAQLLRGAGFHVFAFHRNLRSGAPIEATIAEEVKRSDYFLFLVSTFSASEQRPWVARELGLALASRQTTSGRPIIIPLLCPDAFSSDKKLLIASFPVRNFQTGASLEPFDISMRAHAPDVNPSTDSDELLLKSMMPEILLVGEDITKEEDLYATGVFDLYAQVFPENEQEPVENIVAWIFRRDVGKKFRLARGIHSADSSIFERMGGGSNTYQATTTFFVLVLYGGAIGLAYLTYRSRNRLIYGSYICINEDWRAGNWAGYFLAHIENVVTQRFPGCLGVIFEVDPIVESEVVSALDTLESGSGSEEQAQAAREVVRRLKRVLWYKSIGARLFWDRETGAPLLHTYPCMDPDRPASDWKADEVDYWMMFLPASQTQERGLEVKALWKKSVHESLVESLAKPMTLEYPDKAQQYFRYVVSVYKSSIKKGEKADVVLAPRLRLRARTIASRAARLKVKIAI